MKPDWDYWGQISEPTLQECVLLSCDMEPRESEDENYWRYNREVLTRIEEVQISIYDEELKATSLIGMKLPDETERSMRCTIPRMWQIIGSKRISDKTTINLVGFSRWAAFKGWKIPKKMKSIKRVAVLPTIPEPMPTTQTSESIVLDDQSDPLARYGLSSEELEEACKSMEEPPSNDVPPEELAGFWQSIQDDPMFEPPDTPVFPEQPQPKERLLEWKPEDLSLRGKEGIINKTAVQQGGELTPTTIVFSGIFNVNLMNNGPPLSIYAASTPPTQPEAVACGTTAASSMVGTTDSTSSLLPEPSTHPVTSAKAVAVYGIDPTPTKANIEVANQTRIKNAAARKAAVLSAMEYILTIDATWKETGIPYSKPMVADAIKKGSRSFRLKYDHAIAIEEDKTETGIVTDIENLAKDGHFFFTGGNPKGLTPLHQVIEDFQKADTSRKTLGSKTK